MHTQPVTHNEGFLELRYIQNANTTEPPCGNKNIFVICIGGENLMSSRDLETHGNITITEKI